MLLMKEKVLAAVNLGFLGESKCKLCFLAPFITLPSSTSGGELPVVSINSQDTLNPSVGFPSL